MRLLINEVFDKVVKAKTEQEKIEILRVNYSPALEDVLRWAYDPNIVFYTNTIPPYTSDPSPEGLSYTTLYNEHKRFYLFLRDYKLQTDRKNVLLIQVLEALSSSESKILENVILKNIPEVSKELAMKAYPNFLNKSIKIPMEA